MEINSEFRAVDQSNANTTPLDTYELHSCYYNDFFLLRTPIAINGVPAEVKQVKGSPVLCNPTKLGQASIPFSHISANISRTRLLEFGIYHIELFHHDRVPLFSVAFLSKDALKQFVHNINAVENMLAKAVSNLFTGTRGGIIFQVNCAAELYSISPKTRGSPEITFAVVRRVTIDNYSQYADKWTQSKLLKFEEKMFDVSASLFDSDDEISLQDLHAELTDVVNWFSFGIHLGIPKATLLKIKAEFGPSVDDCCMQLLIKWMALQKPTWPKVIQALRISSLELAKAIAEKKHILFIPMEPADPVQSKKTTKREPVKIESEALEKQTERVQELETEVGRLEDIIEHKQEELSNLYKLRKSDKRKREDLNRKISEKEAEICELKTNLKEKDHQFKEAQSMREKIAREVKKKATEVYDLQDKLESLRTENAAEKERVASLEEKIAILEAQVEAGNMNSSAENELHHRMEIEECVVELLSHCDSLQENESKLADVKEEIDAALKSKNMNSGFEVTKTIQPYRKVPTSHYNTLCSYPNCYSLCHERCYCIEKSTDKEMFRKCVCMHISGSYCKCGHCYTYHYHDEVHWEQVEETKGEIDEDMKDRFEAAKLQVERSQHVKEEYESKQQHCMNEISVLAKRLSLLLQNYEQIC